MDSKGWQMVQKRTAVEDPGASAPAEPDAPSDVAQRALAGLAGIAAALERSDSFLQRLQAINREIERQVRVPAAREGHRRD